MYESTDRISMCRSVVLMNRSPPLSIQNPAQRLSLPAIQSHPFLVGPSKRRAIPLEHEHDPVPQATRSGTASIRSNPAPQSAHTVGQSGRSEHYHEGESIGPGRSKRPGRSEGGLDRSEISGGVERSGDRGRQPPPWKEVPAESHSREHRTEEQRDTQRGRSESTASAGRTQSNVVSEPGLERTAGVKLDHGTASRGSRERAPEAERSWTRASGAQRNGASERTDVRTEQNASETRGSEARPQSSSSRPGTADRTASSDPGGPRAGFQGQTRHPPGAMQLPTRPLSTLRLKALRHETSYGSLTVLEDGRVQVSGYY